MRTYHMPSDKELASYMYEIYALQHPRTGINQNIDQDRHNTISYYLSVAKTAMQIMDKQKLITEDAKATVEMSVRYVKAIHKRNKPCKLFDELDQLLKLRYLDDLI